MKRLCIYLLILAIFSGCSYADSNELKTNQIVPDVVQSSEPAEAKLDLDAYKEKALKLCDEIENSSVALGNMGKWEKNYMQALGHSSDDMIERAFLWLEENSDYTEDSVEAKYDEILELFTEIASEADGDDAITIFEKVSALHDSYIALYCTVTTPPLSPSAFGSELAEIFSTVSNGLVEVRALAE